MANNNATFNIFLKSVRHSITHMEPKDLSDRNRYICQVLMGDGVGEPLIDEQDTLRILEEVADTEEQEIRSIVDNMKCMNQSQGSQGLRSVLNERDDANDRDKMDIAMKEQTMKKEETKEVILLQHINRLHNVIDHANSLLSTIVGDEESPKTVRSSDRVKTPHYSLSGLLDRGPGMLEEIQRELHETLNNISVALFGNT